MKILIVEDEHFIAKYIENQVIQILGSKLKSIKIVNTLDEASSFIKTNIFDLCFLDLNLKGDDGYELLKQSASLPFHTIIISAFTDKAIKAFDYGVIDFIPKPFDLNRLRLAFDKYFGHSEFQGKTKYLVGKKGNKNILIPSSEIFYIKSVSYIVTAYLINDRAISLEKSLKHLEMILPHKFLRIHRSYIVNIEYINSYSHKGGGVYVAELKNGEILPLSRTGLLRLKNILNNS